MEAKPQAQHRWLDQLVGDWTSESDCDLGPDQPNAKFKGRESVRKLGDLWIVAEGETEMPDGGIAGRMRLTIGYDPAKGCYVGNWVGTMMANMWVYEGAVDPDGRTLRLNTEGPGCGPAQRGRREVSGGHPVDRRRHPHVYVPHAGRGRDLVGVDDRDLPAREVNV